VLDFRPFAPSVTNREEPLKQRGLALLLSLFAVAGAAAAQDTYNFTAGISGGVAGAFDLDES